MFLKSSFFSSGVCSLFCVPTSFTCCSTEKTTCYCVSQKKLIFTANVKSRKTGFIWVTWYILAARSKDRMSWTNGQQRGLTMTTKVVLYGCVQKRGTAKSLFICDGGHKMAPSGRIDPKFCMHRAFGMLIPKIYIWRLSGLWPPKSGLWPPFTILAPLGGHTLVRY